MIPWRPIAELPDELKDGREVLLWSETTDWVGPAVAGRWDGDQWWNAGRGSHGYGEGGPISEPTHFAEITPP